MSAGEIYSGIRIQNYDAVLDALERLKALVMRPEVHTWIDRNLRRYMIKHYPSRTRMRTMGNTWFIMIGGGGTHPGSVPAWESVVGATRYLDAHYHKRLDTLSPGAAIRMWNEAVAAEKLVDARDKAQHFMAFVMRCDDKHVWHELQDVPALVYAGMALGNCLDDGNYDHRVTMGEAKVYLLTRKSKPVAALSIVEGVLHEVKASGNHTAKPFIKQIAPLVNKLAPRLKLSGDTRSLGLHMSPLIDERLRLSSNIDVLKLYPYQSDVLNMFQRIRNMNVHEVDLTRYVHQWLPRDEARRSDAPAGALSYDEETNQLMVSRGDGTWMPTLPGQAESRMHRPRIGTRHLDPVVHHLDVVGIDMGEVESRIVAAINIPEDLLYGRAPPRSET